MQTPFPQLFLLVLLSLKTSSEDTNIRAAIYRFPGVMGWNVTEDNVTRIWGFAAEQLVWMTKSANINVSYIPVKGKDVEKLGLPGAIYHQALKGEIDMLPFFFKPSVEKNKNVDFLAAKCDEMVLMVTHPEIDRDGGSYSMLIKPFGKTVWITMTVTYVVFLAITLLKSYSTSIIVINQQSRNTNRYKHINYMSNFNFRMFLGTWGLMTMVLSNSYTTSLISDTTVIKMKPIPNSFEDLARDPDRKIAVSRNDLRNTILSMKSGAMKVLGDQIRENPELTVGFESEEIILQVLKGAAYVGPKGFVNYIIGEDMKKNGNKCRFATSKPLWNECYNYGLSKNYPLREKIMIKSMELEQYAIGMELAPKFNLGERCRVKTNVVKRKPTSLSLKDLSGAFILLGIGLAFSFFLFLLENIAMLQRKMRAHQ